MRTLCLAIGLLASLSSAALSASEVSIPRPVPFSEDNEIAGNIKRECDLGDKLAQFIAEFADTKGVSTRFVASDAEPGEGRFLAIEIRDAVSMGNAFIGHRKSTSVRGKLFEDGELVGSFRARRDSMGGAFAGYKGSCSVLGRTVKALGQDIGAWLAAPSMDADLGDLK
jgi:hypothetical protein